VVGVILTGDQFISSPIERERLHRDFGGHAVEMEGAAVAQVANRFDVDCLVVRALSDMAGDDSELDFSRFLEQVAANSAKVVETIVGMLTQ
jgi:adenosylhomocysteine nucleosidase